MQVLGTESYEQEVQRITLQPGGIFGKRQGRGEEERERKKEGDKERERNTQKKFTLRTVSTPSETEIRSSKQWLRRVCSLCENWSSCRLLICGLFCMNSMYASVKMLPLNVFQKDYKNFLSLALGKGEFKSRRPINRPPDPSALRRIPVKRSQNSSARDLFSNLALQADLGQVNTLGTSFCLLYNGTNGKFLKETYGYEQAVTSFLIPTLF